METDFVMPPIHPGEALMQKHLESLGVTQRRPAVAAGVPPRRISEMAHGKRRIGADTAVRPVCCFGTAERLWLNLQDRYDLEVERDRLGPALEEIQPLANSA